MRLRGAHDGKVGRAGAIAQQETVGFEVLLEQAHHHVEVALHFFDLVGTGTLYLASWRRKLTRW